MRPLLASVAAVALLATPAVKAEVVQKGPLRISVTGELSPRKLPRRGAAPIAVSVGGEISRTGGGLPPQLRTLRIELNRGGRVQSAGLPVCRSAQIQPASTARALRACRAALVGRGSFAVDVALAGQDPYRAKGQLLVFNGHHKGRPALLGQIYSARPFSTSFVIPFAIETKGRGRYGTVLRASLPRAMGEWGHVRELSMRLHRRYRHRGGWRSFISAGCPAPKGFPGAVFPLARTTFGFAGGRKLTSTLTRSCRVR